MTFRSLVPYWFLLRLLTQQESRPKLCMFSSLHDSSWQCYQSLSLPAIAWLCGPPCNPGNTASLIFFSMSYMTFSPLAVTLRTPENKNKHKMCHRKFKTHKVLFKISSTTILIIMLHLKPSLRNVEDFVISVKSFEMVSIILHPLKAWN